MTYPKSSTFPPSEFDGFLLSNIGIQPNGMPLTVLSLLARIGVDPWNQAERLSVLPNELAVSWLAKAISRCPPDSVVPSNATILASDLVNRLPGASHKLRFDGTIASGLEDTPTLTLMMLFYVGTCVFLLMFLNMV